MDKNGRVKSGDGAGKHSRRRFLAACTHQFHDSGRRQRIDEAGASSAINAEVPIGCKWKMMLSRSEAGCWWSKSFEAQKALKRAREKRLGGQFGVSSQQPSRMT